LKKFGFGCLGNSNHFLFPGMPLRAHVTREIRQGEIILLRDFSRNYQGPGRYKRVKVTRKNKIHVTHQTEFLKVRYRGVFQIISTGLLTDKRKAKLTTSKAMRL